MIKFKCKKCGELQYSSNIEIAPCIKCGGKIEVWEIEEEEYENGKRDKERIRKSEKRKRIQAGRCEDFTDKQILDS